MSKIKNKFEIGELVEIDWKKSGYIQFSYYKRLGRITHYKFIEDLNLYVYRVNNFDERDDEQAFIFYENELVKVENPFNLMGKVISNILDLFDDPNFVETLEVIEQLIKSGELNESDVKVSLNIKVGDDDE